MNKCTYANLEVDVFVRVRAHLVAEAELVLARVGGREDVVALSLVQALEDDLAGGAGHIVVDVERAARLNLSASSC